MQNFFADTLCVREALIEVDLIISASLTQESRRSCFTTRPPRVGKASST